MFGYIIKLPLELVLALTFFRYFCSQLYTCSKYENIIAMLLPTQDNIKPKHENDTLL